MSKTVRSRPALFRALGKNDPPPEVVIADRTYRRSDIFKHDSWAATARYRGTDKDIVCKFNRIQPILGLPMSWLGCRLAHREARALHRLDGVKGIPPARGPIFFEGRRLPNAVAHDYVPGHPLGSNEKVNDDFFPTLIRLLQIVHREGMAYVDLHKRENILVGEDGKPYLIDFQVCFGPWGKSIERNPILKTVVRLLQQGDLYHLAKHVKHHRPDQIALLGPEGDRRPWWIKAHRCVGVPLRGLRRSLLVALGVRAKGGMAVSETFAEDAFRREVKKEAA